MILKKADGQVATTLRKLPEGFSVCSMFSVTKFMVALSGAVFLGALGYAGYANELLKDAVSAMHRVVLIGGFIVGAGAVSRWVMVVDIKRNMRRIKSARSARAKVPIPPTS